MDVKWIKKSSNHPALSSTLQDYICLISLSIEKDHFYCHQRSEL